MSIEGGPIKKEESREAIAQNETFDESGGENTLGGINALMAPLLEDLRILISRRQGAKDVELLDIDEKEKEVMAKLTPLLERARRITSR